MKNFILLHLFSHVQAGKDEAVAACLVLMFLSDSISEDYKHDDTKCFTGIKISLHKKILTIGTMTTNSQ